jgi:GAG-pre-integrase domain
MGDLHIELPNGSGKMKTVFKNAVHAPGMAFTLIFIRKLDKAGFSVTFNKGMCTIKNHKSDTITMILHSNGPYKIAANRSNASSTANAASEKMSISEVHRKLGHISHFAIKHAIVNGLITGINLNINSKPEFCKACAKAKLAC